MSFPELVEHGWLLSEEVFKLKLKRRFEVNHTEHHAVVTELIYIQF